MDKNKFWLGGRLSNTASRHVRNARHVRKQGGPTHVRNARHVPKLGGPTHVRNARHVRKLGGPTHVRNANARQGTSANANANARHVRKCKRMARPQRKARPHVRKLGAPTQRKAGPQDGHPNAKLIHNENVHTREN